MSITKIAEVTVGAGGAASIDFTSIAATWTDLMILVSLRDSDTGGGVFYAQFNGDTGANYSFKELRGSGSAASSAGASSGATFGARGWESSNDWTANTFGNATIYIPNYAGSTQKSISVDSVSENNATAAYANISASIWTGTAAITSISIKPATGPFRQYSTASLYGIKSGSLAGVTVA
jgi:hypothetical protein